METSASCYSMMHTVSHYVTMYWLFYQFHGAGLGAAVVPQAQQASGFAKHCQ